MSDESEEENYSLVVPFLNDDKTYAYGVEFGMLYSEMKVENEIKGYFTTSNQDQILLTASRLNWEVIELFTEDSDWFYIEMRKK